MSDRVADLNLTALKAMRLLCEVNRALGESEALRKNDALRSASSALQNHVRYALSRRKRSRP